LRSVVPQRPSRADQLCGGPGGYRGLVHLGEDQLGRLAIHAIDREGNPHVMAVRFPVVYQYCNEDLTRLAYRAAKAIKIYFAQSFGRQSAKIELF
jgi:hypothetical protein